MVRKLEFVEKMKVNNKNQNKTRKIDRKQMIKDKKQNEENDRKDNNSGVSGNKDIENETNTHQKLKGVIQTAYHTSTASKESIAKDEVQMKYTKGRRREPKGKVKENTTITVKMKQK